MKHLLIILSILLLTSTVIGDNHKGESLYLWKIDSVEVWKGFGDKDIQAKYKGDVLTQDVIDMWMSLKREREVDAMRLRPHPYEFSLYYDV